MTICFQGRCKLYLKCRKDLKSLVKYWSVLSHHIQTSLVRFPDFLCGLCVLSQCLRGFSCARVSLYLQQANDLFKCLVYRVFFTKTPCGEVLSVQTFEPDPRGAKLICIFYSTLINMMPQFHCDGIGHCQKDSAPPEEFSVPFSAFYLAPSHVHIKSQ